ncbi:hypothetical protein QYF36_002665 [Acer negundo]|nr:hypothetical protein QYF36_002665 [Acer negundo]
MVNGFDLNQFATILEELFGEKEAHISNQIEIDRLSNLPDHIIYDILSFLDTKYVVQTCVLSNKWRSSKRNKKGKVVLAEPNDGKILITTPRLKFFYLKDVDPLVLSMDDCPSLEKVDILMSKPFCDFFQKIGDKKQMFIRDMFHMIEGLFHVKSLRISLNFTKEKFVLRRNNEETKIAVLNKETGEEQLVWPLYWKKSETRAHEVAAKLLRKQFKNFVLELVHFEVSNYRIELPKQGTLGV